MEIETKNTRESNNEKLPQINFSNGILNYHNKRKIEFMDNKCTYHDEWSTDNNLPISHISTNSEDALKSSDCYELVKELAIDSPTIKTDTVPSIVKQIDEKNQPLKKLVFTFKKNCKKIPIHAQNQLESEKEISKCDFKGVVLPGKEGTQQQLLIQKGQFLNIESLEAISKVANKDLDHEYKKKGNSREVDFGTHIITMFDKKTLMAELEIKQAFHKNMMQNIVAPQENVEAIKQFASKISQKKYC